MIHPLGCTSNLPQQVRRPGRQARWMVRLRCKAEGTKGLSDKKQHHGGHPSDNRICGSPGLSIHLPFPVF